MKKCTIILILICALMCFCCCTRINYISLEQSERNFETYKMQLDEIATQRGYKLKAANNNEDLSIVIDDCKEIKIGLSNSAYESEVGVERFSINYSVSCSQTTNDFDIELFVDLVNCISGKQITSSFCEEFLSAPESKYDAGDYGFQKLNGELVAKIYMFNFTEDWSITYFLNADKTEELCFGGLTKQAVEKSSYIVIDKFEFQTNRLLSLKRDVTHR